MRLFDVIDKLKEIVFSMKFFKSKLLHLCLTGLTALPTISCIKAADDSLLNYSRSAELLYEDAMDDFDDRDCIAAEPKFQSVRKQYPYSRYAVDSELRIADCQFVMENHAEAAVSYEQFVSLHPTHEQADYAAFRRGECFVKLIPKDVFILPPAHERDQAATRDARNTLAQFLKRYPNSPWCEKAAILLQQVVDALVRHEIYVANFYLSRDDRLAAAVRLEKVREHFGESAMVPNAMFLQAMTYLKLDRKADAERVLKEIISYYPEHYQRKRAEDYLSALGKKGG